MGIFNKNSQNQEEPFKVPENFITFKPNELIIRQGGEPKMAYLIKKGSVRVWKKDGEKEIEIARLGKNQIIGEMALIIGYKHSANVTALEETTLQAFSTKTINKLLSKNDPLINRIIVALVERLYNETFLKK
jgi:CRP-like cAMP-binding protein